MDKYILTSIPDPQLEFLFENQNIENYNAELDSANQFKLRICSLGERFSEDYRFSELYSVNIQAERYNPYKRWLSCTSSASRTCNNVLDICGVSCNDELGYDTHNNIFLDVVVTFPFEVDYFLVNQNCRSAIISRMHKCEKTFFSKLHDFFNVPSNSQLGMSSSLHVWSSTIPVLPNGHIHNFIPFFSLNNRESVIEVRDDSNKYKIRDINIQFPRSRKDEYVKRFNNYITVVDNGTRKTFSNKVYGAMGFKTKHFVHVPQSEKFIDDDFLSEFILLKYDMSLEIAEYFNFKSCSWFNKKSPVDVEGLQELWSSIVYDEFGSDILDYWKPLDVHVQFIDSHHKSKILHSLQYKIRPPVLDLDLFFKKCPDFITYYDNFNPEILLSFINYQLQVAINCSNYNDICKYEGLLSKAVSIFDNYSKDEIFNWMEFLSVYKPNTRIHGFWTKFKTFQLDPDNNLFPHNQVCPICDGVVSFVCNVECVDVDSIIVRHRSYFMVFDFDGG